MKCLIYQYDDRGDIYGVSSINKSYADKHGYDYIFFTKYYDNIPVYWQKTFIARDYLEKYDIIFYLDSDALIHYKENPLEYYLEGKTIALSYDLVLHLFIAGAFIIRNNNISKKILDRWCKYYDPRVWKENNGKLYTKSYYSGLEYEQGSFGLLILPEYKEHINVVHDHIFQNSTFIDIPDNTFIIHFYTIDIKLVLYNIINHVFSINFTLNSLYNNLFQVTMFSISKKKRIEMYKRINKLL